MDVIKNYKFIFIGGLHRSGTTIMHECLSEHPEISSFKNTGVIKDEGQFLQTIYLPARFYGGPGRFAFNRKSHLTKNSIIINSKNKNKLFCEWSRYWDLNKSLLLEKSPPNILKMRFLQSIFPKSYFIIMIRHPIAVSLSTRKWRRKWNKGSLSSFIKHWITGHKIYNQDKRYIKHILEIRYEDFIINTDDILKKVYDFLEISYKECSIRIYNDSNKKYFLEWDRLKKQYFYKLIIDNIIKKYEFEINKYNYSLKDY
jgi:hypothetical protein